MQPRSPLICEGLLSSGGRHGAGELSEELAGDVGLEAAEDLAVGLAFGAAAVGVGLGGGVEAQAAAGDGVQGAVEAPVAAAVEPVPDGAPAAGGQRTGTGERGEGRFGVDPARVGEGDEDDGGADRAEAGLVEQAGSEVVDDLGELLLVRPQL